VATDRTSLRDALSILGAPAEIHHHIEFVVSGGDVRSELNLWPAGYSYHEDARIRRGRPRAPTPSSQAMALETNKHMSVDLTYDLSGMVNAPILVGAEKRYEATMPMVPGWYPLENLDNVAAEDYAAAFDAWSSLLPGQFPLPGVAKYLKSNQGHSDVADVGRKWVLNEAGRYPALDGFGNPLYARTVGPFGEESYETFDFASAGIKDYALTAALSGTAEELVPLAPTTWARVPRPFRDLLTEIGDKKLRVDVSFDSGATWVNGVEPVRFLEDEAALLFTPESPLAIVPPAGQGVFTSTGEPMNMWYAIIEGKFRVRVSAVVIGDDCLIPRSGGSALVPGSPMGRTMARVFDRPAFRQDLRVEAFSATSTPPVPIAAPDGDERRDLVKAESWRKATGKRMGTYKIAGKAKSPFLDGAARLSQRVVSVGGVGLSTELRADVEPTYPQVVAVTHRLAYPQSTTMVLGDFRHEPAIPELDE